MLLLLAVCLGAVGDAGFPVYLGQGFARLVHGLAGYLLRDLALWMGLAGLLLLLVGLAMWVVARVGKKVGATRLSPAPAFFGGWSEARRSLPLERRNGGGRPIGGRSSYDGYRRSRILRFI